MFVYSNNSTLISHIVFRGGGGCIKLFTSPRQELLPERGEALATKRISSCFDMLVCLLGIDSLRNFSLLCDPLLLTWRDAQGNGCSIKRRQVRAQTPTLRHQWPQESLWYVITDIDCLLYRITPITLHITLSQLEHWLQLDAGAPELFRRC